jgi:hypothetical protein
MALIKKNARNISMFFYQCHENMIAADGLGDRDVACG